MIVIIDITNKIGKFLYRLFGLNDPRPFYMKLFNFAVKNIPFAKQKYQNDLAKSKASFIKDMTKHFENQESELQDQG